MPGRRRGQQQRAGGGFAEFGGEERGAAQLAQDEVFQLGGRGQEPVGFQRLVAFGQADDEAVVAPHGFDFDAALGAQLRGDGHAPGRVHAAAERGEDADATVAEFVAAALDDDVAIAGHAAGGGGLVFEIAQQVLGGVGIEAVFFHQAREGGGARRGKQFARHFADLAAELGGPPGAIAVPEGHLAGLAGRGRDDDAIVRDLVDAPGGGAEDDGVAGAALEDHLFVEFADARAAGGAGQEDGEQAAVGDGAAVDDGDVARALARGELVGDAVPGEARAQFGELVGGIAAGEHVEHAIEDAAGEGGVGRGAGGPG